MNTHHATRRVAFHLAVLAASFTLGRVLWPETGSVAARATNGGSEIWHSFQFPAGAVEADLFSSIEEMAAASDAIVAGRVIRVTRGRTVDLGLPADYSGPWVPTQFYDLTVAVGEDLASPNRSSARAEVTVEVLDFAGDAQATVAERFGDASATHLFFLKRPNVARWNGADVALPGAPATRAYRIINSQGLIAPRLQGRAAGSLEASAIDEAAVESPLRHGEHEPAEGDAFAASLAKLSFGEVVARARSAARAAVTR